MGTRRSFGDRVLKMTAYLRHVMGPAEVGSKENIEMVRSAEQRQRDLDRMHLRRVINPDGSSYLVKDTDPSA